MSTSTNANNSVNNANNSRNGTRTFRTNSRNGNQRPRTDVSNESARSPVPESKKNLDRAIFKVLTGKTLEAIRTAKVTTDNANLLYFGSVKKHAVYDRWNAPIFGKAIVLTDEQMQHIAEYLGIAEPLKDEKHERRSKQKSPRQAPPARTATPAAANDEQDDASYYEY